MHPRRLARHRDRRQPAALVAVLVSLVIATGGCTVTSLSSRAATPVSTTSPTSSDATPSLSEASDSTQAPLVLPSPLVLPLPLVLPPALLPRPASTPRSPSPTPRRPKQGWAPDWEMVPQSTPTTTARSTEAGGDVTAVGDSIMVDAMPNLRSLFPGITTDALAGRQVAAGLAVLQNLATTGRLLPDIVIELGTNGTFTPAQMDRIFALTAGRHLVLLTNHCGYCTWVPSNNALMAARCTPDVACTVADWQALSLAHPEWFAHDGVHMAIGGVGAEAFAQLIARSLGKSIPASRLNPASLGDPAPDRPLRAAEPS